MRPPPTRMPPAVRWILAATSFGFVVVQLDVTIVNVALPRIATDLRVGMAGLQWVVDAYTLAFAVLLLSAGVLGDRFGSKRAYLVGFLIFGASSLACGVAPNGGVLIGARALQGVGAALLVPSSLALLNHASAHDRRLRARAIGLWTAASAAAITLGPIVGSLLLQAMGWRSIFFVNLPLCAVGTALTIRAVPRDASLGRGHPLDPAGQLLAIVVMTGLIGGVIEFRPLGWSHPVVAGGFLIAIVGSLVFVAAEARAKEPMLPLHFFRLPNFSAATAVGILVNLTYYGIIFVLSLYLQEARGYSVLQAGLAYLPLTATFIASNLASGWIAGRVGSRTPMMSGALIGATGFALLASIGPKSTFLAMLPAFVLIPGGMGLAVPAMTTAILSSVERGRSGTASAMLNAARQGGGAVGVAVFGAISGGSALEVASGLRTSAVASSFMLVIAAGLSWKFIRPHGHA
jgi:DHA2 family methylenomycin A resistance protein-like MFS transporter